MKLRHTVEDSVEFRQRNERTAARKYLPIDIESYLGRGLSSWSQNYTRDGDNMQTRTDSSFQVKNINMENNTVCPSQLNLYISTCAIFFGPEIEPENVAQSKFNYKDSVVNDKLSMIFHHHHHHHHHLLPPWIRSFDLFRYRRVASFSWGVHDLFVLGVCC